MRIGMKVLLAAAVAVVCSATSDGHHRRRSDCGDCGAPCGMTVSYVERQVTAYRAEWRTKPVQVTVYKMETKEIEVPYKYTVYEQVITPTKQTITKCQQVVNKVPYKYTVHE